MSSPLLPFFKCPRCGWVSYHPDDLRHGYCGHCHDFTTVDVEEISLDDLALVGRVRMAIAEGHGLVIFFYASDDTNRLLGRFLLPAHAAEAYLQQLADSVDSLRS